MSARDDLACKIRWASRKSTTAEQACDAADVLLADGYRKPKVLGYVVVDRDGNVIAGPYEDAEGAQSIADRWTTDCQASEMDWGYRVAEIVEAAQ